MKRSITIAIGLLISGLATPGHSFVMPYTAEVSLQVVGGNGSGVSDFGLGTSPDDFVAHLFGLPTFSEPVFVGTVNVGEELSFGFRRVWGGITYEAFSGQVDEASGSRSLY